MTRIPNARAREATSRPICPSPTTPSRRPYSPRALEYSPLFQRPWRRSAVWSGIRRSQASSRPITSSATAIEFLPGQLLTKIPRLEAGATAILSMAAPARITRVSAVPAPSASAPTFLLRTMRMCGSVSRIRAASPSAFTSGWETTSHPSSLRPSIPTFSNLSAMRTFIRSLQLVDEQPAAQLGLEPGALGRHYLPGIRHRHELLQRGGEQREGDRHLARLHPPGHGLPRGGGEQREAAPHPPGAPPPGQLRRPPDSPHEVDPLVGARVADAQDRPQHPVLEQGHVQRRDRVVPVDGGGIQLQPM